MSETMKKQRRIEVFGSEHMGLAWEFQVNPVSCGNHEHYENYLRLIAIRDRNDGRGVTHVVLDADKISILGFVTVKASSLVEMIEGRIEGEPAMEIAELAVAAGCERMGIGRTLIKFAAVTAMQMKREKMGIRYITLCADEMSVPFYERVGFMRLESRGEIPREGWNENCIPMYLKLPTE